MVNSWLFVFLYFPVFISSSTHYFEKYIVSLRNNVEKFNILFQFYIQTIFLKIFKIESSINFCSSKCTYPERFLQKVHFWISIIIPLKILASSVNWFQYYKHILYSTLFSNKLSLSFTRKKRVANGQFVKWTPMKRKNHGPLPLICPGVCWAFFLLLL